MPLITARALWPTTIPLPKRARPQQLSQARRGHILLGTHLLTVNLFMNHSCPLGPCQVEKSCSLLPPSPQQPSNLPTSPTFSHTFPDFLDCTTIATALLGSSNDSYPASPCVSFP